MSRQLCDDTGNALMVLDWPLSMNFDIHRQKGGWRWTVYKVLEDMDNQGRRQKEIVTYGWNSRKSGAEEAVRNTVKLYGRTEPRASQIAAVRAAFQVATGIQIEYDVARQIAAAVVNAP